MRKGLRLGVAAAAVMLVSGSASKAEAQSRLNLSRSAAYLDTVAVEPAASQRRPILETATEPPPSSLVVIPESLKMLSSRLPIAFVSRVVSPRVDVPHLGTWSISPHIGGGNVAITITRKFSP